MALKHRKSTSWPDTRAVKDTAVSIAMSELYRFLQDTFKNIFDDLESNGVQRQNFDNEVEFLAGLKFNRTATAVTYTALVTDCIIGVTSTASARTINLPLAATAGEGKIFVIKDESGGAAANNITIDGSGAETIDGAATKVISTNYGTATLYCSGTAWFSI